MLIISRLIAGTFGSSPLANAGGSLADIWMVPSHGSEFLIRAASTRKSNVSLRSSSFSWARPRTHCWWLPHTIWYVPLSTLPIVSKLEMDILAVVYLCVHCHA